MDSTNFEKLMLQSIDDTSKSGYDPSDDSSHEDDAREVNDQIEKEEKEKEEEKKEEDDE